MAEGSRHFVISCQVMRKATAPQNSES
jgi:hypothetical protein